MGAGIFGGKPPYNFPVFLAFPAFLAPVYYLRFYIRL
jgi:hypothetical protein